MFVLFWATLFLSVRISNAVADPVQMESCHDGICVSKEITAEAGLCVVIPCNFSIDPGFKMEKAEWCKDEKTCHEMSFLNQTNQKAEPGFGGRVSQLEPKLDLRFGNCSIMIHNLTMEDTGTYQFKLTGILNGTKKKTYYSPEATVNFQDLTQKPTVMIPPLTEGQQSTLTCTAPGLCSESDPEITWTWRGTGGNELNITGNITSNGRQSSLTFNPSAAHHGLEVTCRVSFTGDIRTEETVTLNVTYIKRPIVTGETTVKEGSHLNLNCSVESFPPANVNWTKLGSSEKLNNDTETNMATLVISNVTVEDFGQYICTARHLITVEEQVSVKVISNPKILNSSACLQLSEVLTCMCISQGFPLPTITWPMLENHTFYSVITTKSNNTVNSTVSLAVKEQHGDVVECVSQNPGNGGVRQNLNVTRTRKTEEEYYMKWLKLAIQLEVIIAFLVGALLSAFICCLVIKCHWRKHKTIRNPVETLEMVTSHEDPLIVGNQVGEDDQAAEGGRAAAAGKQEVEYSHLDFNLIKGRSPAEAGVSGEATETEYAEIKKEDMEERQEGEGQEEEEGEKGGVVEVEVEVVGVDNEGGKQCVSDEKVDGEMALYSNVKDIMENEDNVA